MTNYEKYFGMPELAAEMIADSEVRADINHSFFRFFNGLDAEWKHLKSEEKYAYARKWLESEADNVQLG